MCELTHGMAGERHGHGMGTAWARHAMCESAFTLYTQSVVNRSCPVGKSAFCTYALVFALTYWSQAHSQAK